MSQFCKLIVLPLLIGIPALSSARTWTIMMGLEIRYLDYDVDQQGKRLKVKYAQQLEVSPILEIGINFQPKKAKTTALGFDLNWLLHKDCFSNKPVQVNPYFGDFTIPAWTLILLPVPDLNIGLHMQDGSSFKFGLTYLWGLHSAVELPTESGKKIVFKHRWFFDRFTYLDGFHDMHALVGTKF